MGEISYFFSISSTMGKKPSLLQNPITGGGGGGGEANGQKKIQQYKIFWNIPSLQTED